VTAPLGRNIPAPVTPVRQADWKLEARYGTWHADKRNRIFYARTAGETAAWNYHLYETYQTRKALHQNFSRYGLLAIFVAQWAPGFSVEGVYLAGRGGLAVQIRTAPPPPPIDCSVDPLPSVCVMPLPAGPTGATGATDVASAPRADSSVPGSSAQYRLIAIRKDSLPAPVKRLYITEFRNSIRPH
jgi:hypothetical protein